MADLKCYKVTAGEAIVVREKNVRDKKSSAEMPDLTQDLIRRM